MKKANGFWEFLHKFERVGFILMFVIVVLASINIVNVFVKFLPQQINEWMMPILMFLVAIEGCFFHVGRKRRQAQ